MSRFALVLSVFASGFASEARAEEALLEAWIDTEQVAEEEATPTNATDSRDRDHATYAGWTRDQIFTAWKPKASTVRDHSDYQTRVVFNVDASGRISSPVIVSTNASSDFHASIQKAISSVTLTSPPPGQGRGIVIDFYADPAYR